MLPRQLIEQPDFEKRKRAVFKSDQGADVALEAVTMLLATHLDLTGFQFIAATPLGDMRVIRTADTPVFRSAVIYFIVGSMDRIYLADIRWATGVP